MLDEALEHLDEQLELPDADVVEGSDEVLEQERPHPNPNLDAWEEEEEDEDVDQEEEEKEEQHPLLRLQLCKPV